MSSKQSKRPKQTTSVKVRRGIALNHNEILVGLRTSK
ncbi:hypothetical protein SAMN05421684_7526 [Asanoa ishikariensis]|uniref:Uncharacterized protein n=1 Tax=Asanoa ishikariensis TaxID=137265 RepID=A0A1H3UM57_9ACTN|nr:hypothetical protein SAMN05421684_7526 [Asanoa ishikariensis]